MRCTSWLVLGLALFTVNVGHAQYIFPPLYPASGQYQYSYMQIRTGPNSGFFVYNAQFRIGPSVPPWYYMPIGGPVNQPPVIIQNIIQPPEPPRDRGFVVPADFAPPRVNPGNVGANVAPKPAPMPAMPKLGPAPQVGVIPVPEVPKPARNGRVEADAFTEQARKAFADGQYGRSLELFRKARDLMPNEASMYFLMAQAQFALGKYADAVTSLTTGTTHRADWPDARYAPRDLYGKNEATFDEHLKLLRDTLTTFRDDTTLTFLLGHQLWFDGQRDDAKKLLRQAAGQGSVVAGLFR